MWYHFFFNSLDLFLKIWYTNIIMRLVMRIVGYKDKRTEEVLEHGVFAKKLPPTVVKKAYKMIYQIRNADNLNRLRYPPANRLEKLKGDREGQYSLRLNEQFRLCFNLIDGETIDNVEIVDYH